MKFSQKFHFPGGKLPPLILAVVSAISIGLYLITSIMHIHKVGFPLDDAWIHQTYARNLAQTGRWEYFRGQPSAGGSTSPLWTMLLSLGYALHIDFRWWAFSLGALFLYSTSLLAEYIARHANQNYSATRIPWVGMLLALEWHVAWAAVSGMETILHIFLVTLFFFLLFVHPRKLFALGLVAGASIWVRPDGATLIIPLLGTIALASNTTQRLKNTSIACAGFTAASLPYFVFNLLISGTFLPNTFTAKQAEYASLQATPLLQRYFQQLGQPAIGVGIILLPLIFLQLAHATASKNWPLLSAFTWIAMYAGLYAARLPVTYQHGRYAMPTIPVFLLSGSLAAVDWYYSAGTKKRHQLKNFYLMATAGISLGFLITGANTFARDVTYIESEMVATARWVNANLPKDALIASHDIGALGYYGSHRLIDLAGLISPQVIPFIRDQKKLAQYLDSSGTTYLVAFPGWYPQMTASKKIVFSTQSEFAQKYGGENMAVFIWK